MLDNHTIALKTLVEAFRLEVVFAATDYEAIRLTVADVARPGLQLAGYLDHFEPMRLQVIGNVESSYLDKMTAAERLMVYDRLFTYKIPALIAARGLVPGPSAWRWRRSITSPCCVAGRLPVPLFPRLLRI